MSLMRSPNDRGTTGGSQPDLSKLRDLTEINITQRKRKQPETDCDCKKELLDFRKEVKEMLENFSKSQMEYLSSLRNDISQIMAKVNNIETTTINLASEQTKILTDISELKNRNTASEEKIKNIESDLQKISSAGKYVQSIKEEHIIQEIRNRSNRENNTIIVGVPEAPAGRFEERQECDTNAVLNALKCIIKDVPQPIKIIRLGKFKSGSNRPIKVCFSSPDISKNILRNRKNTEKNGIKIFADLTPAQQAHLKELKEKLSLRQKNGEVDLTIKYVNGVPKIITQAKN